MTFNTSQAGEPFERQLVSAAVAETAQAARETHIRHCPQLDFSKPLPVPVSRTAVQNVQFRLNDVDIRRLARTSVTIRAYDANGDLLTDASDMPSF